MSPYNWGKYKKKAQDIKLLLKQLSELNFSHIPTLFNHAKKKIRFLIFYSHSTKSYYIPPNAKIIDILI